MDDQVVFAIDDVSRVENNFWRVDGRAYQDVRVGDIVKPYDDRMARVQAALAYTITAISTYGKDAPELSRGLTGSLIIEGLHGDLLRTGSTLIR